MKQREHTGHVQATNGEDALTSWRVQVHTFASYQKSPVNPFLSERELDVLATRELEQEMDTQHSTTLQQRSFWDVLLHEPSSMEPGLYEPGEDSFGDDDIEAEKRALLQRGSALLEELDPLPGDFWTQETSWDVHEEDGQLPFQDPPSSDVLMCESSTISTVIPGCSASTEHEVQSLYMDERTIDEPGCEAPVAFGEGGTDGINSWLSTRSLGLLGTLCVGALLLGVMFPNTRSWLMEPQEHTKAGVSFTQFGAPTAEHKGRRGKISMRIEYRRKGVIRRMPRVLRPKRGDELRFLVRNTFPSRLYLVLFLVEGKGVVSLLFPNTKNRFVWPKTKKEIALRKGAVLSPSSGDERIYVCASKRPIGARSLRRWFRARLKRTSVRKIRSFRLRRNPCVYQKTWLLKVKP
ncbi:MAG: hypothetical protein CL920_03475 [Deltaproteobacteria bacterium]|nr:hypothetical protein [Deltaproteobacteria bacterium]|tara:strand:+ start:17155 stop:18375 length:1221 start_codon:yes stop_codon:yes gene_type:complete